MFENGLKNRIQGYIKIIDVTDRNNPILLISKKK